MELIGLIVLLSLIGVIRRVGFGLFFGPRHFHMGPPPMHGPRFRGFGHHHHGPHGPRF